MTPRCPPTPSDLMGFIVPFNASVLHASAMVADKSAVSQ